MKQKDHFQWSERFSIPVPMCTVKIPKKFRIFDPDDLACQHQMEVFTNKRKRAFGTLSSFLRASKLGLQYSRRHLPPFNSHISDILWRKMAKIFHSVPKWKIYFVIVVKEEQRMQFSTTKMHLKKKAIFCCKCSD